jgi:hypothetical protein
MSKKKVRTRADIQKITGVGEAKISKYGDALIENIARWLKIPLTGPAAAEHPLKENI